MDKFISMEIEGEVIMDSLQFLKCGLDKQGSNIKDKGLKENKSLKDTFPTVHTYFKKEWGHLDEEEVFELLTRKGVFPYEYIDSFERFKETKLPEKEKYYSTLSNMKITDGEHEFAMDLWGKLKLYIYGDPITDFVPKSLRI